MLCLLGISMTLIAIVAGMLLLAKTQKDNLGSIYKAVSYFVIITAFLGFLGGLCGGLCHLASGKGIHGGAEKCQMMGGGCMGGSCMSGGGGHCKMMGGGMGCEKEMGCGKGKKKCKKMCKSTMMGWEDEGEEMEDINVEIIQKEVEKEKPAKEEPGKK